MKNYFLLAGATLLVAGSAQAQSVKVGIKAGANLSNLTNQD